MRTAELKTVAASLLEAGAPGWPTVVLAREVPVFEVEFAELAFAEEAKLPLSDWAVLTLARALGTLSPADVDAYLGLGETVSEGLVRRLLEEALLDEVSAQSVSAPMVMESGLISVLRRIFDLKAPPIQTVVSPSRATTAARTLHESRASTTSACRLSAAGSQALDRGAIARSRVRPARLRFLAEPLLFLDVIDEKRERHSQHRRPALLEPESVPEVFRVLDTVFALPPDERLSACGIETNIRGISGQFLGIVPGSSWEVRPLERRNSKGRESQMALLVLAAFPSSDAGGLYWRAYLRQHERTQDCPHLDAAHLLPVELRALSSLLRTIDIEGPLPAEDDLRDDGAFDLRCDDSLLPDLLGGADLPDDTFLQALAPGWWVGLRTHAKPADIFAGRAAFYDFLQRRDANLRRDFDGTCAAVAASLISYWGENPGLPSVDEAASNLWARAELRAALCLRRRHRDLVAPYESLEAR